MPSSYWVEPGRLLAGEYPGATLGEKPERLRQLLEAGFNSFIDLTAEDELPPYHGEFDGDVVHRRFAIIDHGIPDSTTTMRDVVAAIAKDLADGRRIYLHCRAGIGRTGTAVGCYLISQGLDGDAALEKLQTLWQRCSRARSWPSVPETEEQTHYVRQWSPLANLTTPALDRAQGALLGLAVGESLAIAMRDAPAETAWASVSQNIERLTTGADTAMTIAVADSLLEHGAHEPRDQLTRYLEWTRQPAVQALVPAELKRVLAVWQWSRKPHPGSHDPQNLDAHVLARTAAAVLFSRSDVQRAVELAAEVSRTTLQSPLALDACRLWAATLSTVVSGAAKHNVLTLHAARAELQKRQLKPQISSLLQGQWQAQEWPDGALRLLAGALEIFRVTHSFDAAIRDAMRAESTSLGALVGTLAGAFYGASAIAPEWRRALPQGEQLETLAARLVK